jgi:putative DNA primase/helicase
LLQEPGYNRSSKLLFNPDGVTFPKVSERPSKRDAEDALAKLTHLFSEFPFVSRLDLSVAIAALLTSVTRRSFNIAPAFGVDSPDYGTGKSYLVDTLHMTAHGVVAAVIDATTDNEEFRKRIETELKQGAAAIALDNVTGIIGGDTFSSILTSEYIKPRTMGGNTHSPELPTNAFITLTGKQLKIRADLIRRILRAMMDAKIENHWKRKFTLNPVEMARTDRGDYVKAILTILKAYHVAGCGVNFDSFCGYEEWSRLVRGAVVWVGLPDPFGSIEVVATEDPEKIDLFLVCSQWETRMGRANTTIAKVINMACMTDQQETGPVLKYPEFHDILFKITGSKDGFINSTRLGYWLREHKDVVVSGKKLVSDGLSAGVARWRLVNMEKDEGPVSADANAPF